MTIRFSQSFVKEYRKLPKPAQNKVKKFLNVLAKDLSYSGLRVHKMVNQDDIYEGRIDIHYRVTFKKESNILFMRRVGTHEIYRNP